MDPSWVDSYAFRFFPLIISVIFWIFIKIMERNLLRRGRLRREALVQSMNRLVRSSAPRILESAVLNAVPVLLYPEERRWTECAVCSSGFAENDELVRVLPRHGHCFHVRCIDTWFRSRTSRQWWEKAQRNRVQSGNRA